MERNLAPRVMVLLGAVDSYNLVTWKPLKMADPIQCQIPPLSKETSMIEKLAPDAKGKCFMPRECCLRIMSSIRPVSCVVTVPAPWTVPVVVMLLMMKYIVEHAMERILAPMGMGMEDQDLHQL